MQFDVIIGNPPYQHRIGDTKTTPIWNKFVTIAFDFVKDGGIVCLIHPNGWRDVSGPFDEVKHLLLSNNIEYLEMHNVKDSKKHFRNIQIMYDWYIAKKEPFVAKTDVKFINGKVSKMNLKNFPFIPSGNPDIFKLLIANDDEERVNIMFDSKYHHQKPHMSKLETDVFKYPCVYTIKKDNSLNLWYSNIDRGHFGIPKFIWGNGVCSSIGNIIDYDGKYGLTEFSYSILDSIENLENFKKTFNSKRFQSLMKTSPNKNDNYNRKVISLFKKDFWKYFI